MEKQIIPPDYNNIDLAHSFTNNVKQAISKKLDALYDDILNKVKRSSIEGRYIINIVIEPEHLQNKDINFIKKWLTYRLAATGLMVKIKKPWWSYNIYINIKLITDNLIFIP